MTYTPISINSKFDLFSDLWHPKIIAQMNDYHLKIVRLQGDFVWHCHNETDEVFIVIEGEMVLKFRDGEARLKTGEMFVVPRGIEHKPMAEKECRIMLIEPVGVVNTGENFGEMTAANDVWI